MKRVSPILLILTCIIAIGLIPANLCWIHFYIPEYVSIIISLLVILAAVYFLKTYKNIIANIAAVFFAAISVIVSILGSYCNPYWNSVTFRMNSISGSKPYDYRLYTDEALEDFSFSMKFFKKLHSALYGEIPEDVRRQCEIVKERLKQRDDISVNELAREIESVFAVLRDGHTSVSRNFSDYMILKHYNKWKNEGYEITAVNGVTTDKLLNLKNCYYSFEVSSWEKELLMRDLITESGLDYLGFDLENGIEYTLGSPDGKVLTEICYLKDFISLDKYMKLYGNDSANDSFVSYKIDLACDLAILLLDECNYNSEYINCVRSMFEEIKERQIHNVAVDLRYNSGGNGGVVNEFLRYFDIDSYKTPTLKWRLGFINLNLKNGTYINKKYEDLLFRGNLYLLTSTNTFSSAMLFAQIIKDNRMGIIIGEAPGNNPNGYGDVALFKLPNSELLISISTKQFYRADRECADELIYPDIECKSEDAMEELYKILKDNK